MMVCLLGLLSTERLASEMSAVTRVMEILGTQRGQPGRGGHGDTPTPTPLSPHCHPRADSWRGRSWTRPGQGFPVGLGVLMGFGVPSMVLGIPPMELGVLHGITGGPL